MKYLIVLLMLMMTGCGYGYHVAEKRMYPCNGTHDDKLVAEGKCGTQILWVCRFTTPAFFNDLDKAVCDTKEECSKICLELSK